MMPLSALNPAKSMPKRVDLAPLDAFLEQRMPLVRALHARGNGPKWGLSEKDFGEALHRSAEKRFRGEACSDQQLEDYLGSLDLEDLALACACGLGIEAA